MGHFHVTNCHIEVESIEYGVAHFFISCILIYRKILLQDLPLRDIWHFHLCRWSSVIYITFWILFVLSYTTWRIVSYLLIPFFLWVSFHWDLVVVLLLLHCRLRVVQQLPNNGNNQGLFHNIWWLHRILILRVIYFLKSVTKVPFSLNLSYTKKRCATSHCRNFLVFSSSWNKVLLR